MLSLCVCSRCCLCVCVVSVCDLCVCDLCLCCLGVCCLGVCCLCVCDLCLCGLSVCVVSVCVVSVCVVSVWREEEAGSGMRHRKEEPHTKMWGTNSSRCATVTPPVDGPPVTGYILTAPPLNGQHENHSYPVTQIDCSAHMSLPDGFPFLSNTMLHPNDCSGSAQIHV